MAGKRWLLNSIRKTGETRKAGEIHAKFAGQKGEAGIHLLKYGFEGKVRIEK
jgi:hypothetical protein